MGVILGALRQLEEKRGLFFYGYIGLIRRFI